MAQTPFFSYNDAMFRTSFPQFAEAMTYPAPTIQAYFDAAGLYIANSNFGPLYRAGATLPALNLMTAHLLAIGNTIAAGQQSGTVVGATIDKISVQLQQFQFPNQWSLWLNGTEYGKQLLALLQVQSIGGFYSVGGPGRAGFRW
jgi:uncharacterized protein DUF4054